MLDLTIIERKAQKFYGWLTLSEQNVSRILFLNTVLPHFCVSVRILAVNEQIGWPLASCTLTELLSVKVVRKWFLTKC